MIPEDGKPTAPKVSVVVVTWNRKDLVARCLEALMAQTVRPAEVIVVDNHSTDGTDGMLRDRFPWVVSIRTPSNVGGAGGFHVGMKAAVERGADQVWLMDDDAWAEPQALERLLEASEEIRPAPAFVCSRVVDQDGRGINFPARFRLLPETGWDGYLARGYLPIEACTFVSVLFPADRIRERGLPLAHYFIWLDDSEYTLRLTRDRTGWFVANSRVNHVQPKGMALANLRLERSPGRIPLYRHYFSNTLETVVRHLDRYGRRAVVGYYRSAAADWFHLLFRGDFAKIAVLQRGVALGTLRSLRFLLGRPVEGGGGSGS